MVILNLAQIRVKIYVITEKVDQESLGQT